MIIYIIQGLNFVKKSTCPTPTDKSQVDYQVQNHLSAPKSTCPAPSQFPVSLNIDLSRSGSIWVDPGRTDRNRAAYIVTYMYDAHK